MEIFEYIVYHEPLNPILELKSKIIKAFASNDGDALGKVYKNRENRLYFVLREATGHFAQLLNWENPFLLRIICIIEH